MWNAFLDFLHTVRKNFAHSKTTNNPHLGHNYIKIKMETKFNNVGKHIAVILLLLCYSASYNDIYLIANSKSINLDYLQYSYLYYSSYLKYSFLNNSYLVYIMWHKIFNAGLVRFGCFCFPKRWTFGSNMQVIIFY